MTTNTTNTLVTILLLCAPGPLCVAECNSGQKKQCLLTDSLEFSMGLSPRYFRCGLEMWNLEEQTKSPSVGRLQAFSRLHGVWSTPLRMCHSGSTSTAYMHQTALSNSAQALTRQRLVMFASEPVVLGCESIGRYLSNLSPLGCDGLLFSSRAFHWKQNTQDVCTSKGWNPRMQMLYKHCLRCSTCS